MSQGAGGRGGFFSSMFGNGGGQQDEGNQQQQQQGGQQRQEEIPNENQLSFGNQREEGEFDPSSILSEFFTEEQEDEQQEQNQGQQQQQQQQPQLDQNGRPLPTQQEQQIMAGIQDIMKGLIPPEDLFDEDFNPNDPKAMRTLLSQVQQQTAQASLQAMLIPMREAMATLTKELKEDFANQLQNHGNQSNARSILERIVPEVRGEHSGMVNTLYAQAMKKKGATPEKAAGAVRQALDALGIKGQRSNQADPSSGASRRTGNDALDIYAPLK